jgi:hypothetical protein
VSAHNIAYLVIAHAKGGNRRKYIRECVRKRINTGILRTLHPQYDNRKHVLKKNVCKIAQTVIKNVTVEPCVQFV